MAHKVQEIDTRELREALRKAGERALEEARGEEAPGGEQVLGVDPGSSRKEARGGASGPEDASEAETAKLWLDLDLWELQCERLR